MRWIGPSLLVLALVFSTGGVAIVGQADSPAGGRSVEHTAHADPSTPAPAEPSTCAPQGGFRRTTPAPPRVLKDAAGNKSIVLNTSGYNYVLEGEWRPDPTAKPQGVPDGVLPDGALPKGHESAPPAAPEAK